MLVTLARPNYYSHLITPPLGIGYVAGYLREKGIECRVVDGLNLGLDAAAMADACAGSEIVGLTCLSDYYPEIVELTKLMKRRGQCVALGGPHASALPQETLDETGCDFVVVGEGEQTMAEIVAYVDAGGNGELPAGVVSSHG